MRLDLFLLDEASADAAFMVEMDGTQFDLSMNVLVFVSGETESHAEWVSGSSDCAQDKLKLNGFFMFLLCITSWPRKVPVHRAVLKRFAPALARLFGDGVPTVKLRFGYTFKWIGERTWRGCCEFSFGRHAFRLHSGFMNHRSVWHIPMFLTWIECRTAEFSALVLPTHPRPQVKTRTLQLDGIATSGAWTGP